ncbi:MAG: Tricarboxylate transport protein TctC [Betaproteobacteria bacterium]|nr:Tricarboxylate transport protein TctC [Betaproteobacteria bacterium]
MAIPDMKKRLSAEGAEPATVTTPEDFGKVMKEKIAKWTRVAQRREHQAGMICDGHAMKRAFGRAMACLLASAATGMTAHAQLPAAESYPAKPVKIIVPYTPGGANDILARTVLTKAIADLGQNTIVDNRAGGNTVIGTQLAARSAPDGYTLVTVDNAYVSAPGIQPNLPYDTLKDFVRVTMIASTSPVFVVHPSLPVKTVKELIALARARPGVLTYGTTGAGTTAHLAFAQIKVVTGLDAIHVPYKGGAQQITALISGEVSMLISVPAALLAHIKAGRMRALAVSGSRRLPSLPELPTLQEAGIPVVVDAFWGLLAPAGTNPAIVNKLQEAVERTLKIPEMRTRLDDMQFQPMGNPPAQFEEFVQREVTRWISVAKAADIKLE